MNDKKSPENWDKIKTDLMAANPNITAAELICEIGKEKEVLIKLQKQLKANKKDIDNYLNMMG